MASANNELSFENEVNVNKFMCRILCVMVRGVPRVNAFWKEERPSGLAVLTRDSRSANLGRLSAYCAMSRGSFWCSSVPCELYLYGCY